MVFGKFYILSAFEQKLTRKTWYISIMEFKRKSNSWFEHWLFFGIIKDV